MANVQEKILSTSGTRSRYDNVAIALHWLIALAVLGNVALALYMDDIPRSDPMKFQIVQFHKAIGLTVLVLSIVRIGWRLMNPPPLLPADMGAAQKMLARTVEFLLYVLIVAIPLAGWLMVSASPLGLPTSYFGLFDWPNLWLFADMTRESKKFFDHTFEEAHQLMAWSAMALVGLHVAAALYHHHIRHDGVLKSMLPGG